MAEAQKQQVPYQPPLFTVTSRGELMIRPGGRDPRLTSASSLEIARWWYRRHLEQERRPINTITSYMYDLALLQDFIGPKPVERITRQAHGTFLDLAQNKSTRKRRLTSIGGLFRYLIKDEHILTQDPSDKFFPDFIPLKTPQVLFPDEQERLLAAAQAENLRTYLIVWLLLKLGLTRAELLALKVDHVDMSDRRAPAGLHLLRRCALAAERAQAGRHRRLRQGLPPVPGRIQARAPPVRDDAPVGQQAGRPRGRRRRHPQARHAPIPARYLCRRTGQGRRRPSTKLAPQILGLAPDSRNRRSVGRYTKLAAPHRRSRIAPFPRDLLCTTTPSIIS